MKTPPRRAVRSAILMVAFMLALPGIAGCFASSTDGSARALGRAPTVTPRTADDRRES